MATSATNDDKRVTKRVDYCCVPHCNGNGRLHKDLSFHRTPSEKKVEVRKRWIIAIRRDEGPDFKVCIQCKHRKLDRNLHDIHLKTSFMLILYKLMKEKIRQHLL